MPSWKTPSLFFLIALLGSYVRLVTMPVFNPTWLALAQPIKKVVTVCLVPCAIVTALAIVIALGIVVVVALGVVVVVALGIVTALA